MKRQQPPKPLFNIGDYVGADVRSNQWGNEWYEDGGLVVKIEYGYVPYSSSGDYYPDKQFVYTLNNGNIIGERSIKRLSGGEFYL